MSIADSEGLGPPNAPRRGRLRKPYGKISEKSFSPEIGALVRGIDSSAVSQARSRLKKKLGRNQTLKERFEKIRRKLADLSRLKSSPPFCGL